MARSPSWPHLPRDPAVVAFKLPGQIAWKDNPSGNRTAVLQGDPAKPGPYAMLLQWLPGNMSRAHFHPNDRFIIVLSGRGGWDPARSSILNPPCRCPPAATSSFSLRGVHFDGAKNEQATILIWGEGPATRTQVPVAGPM